MSDSCQQLSDEMNLPNPNFTQKRHTECYLLIAIIIVAGANADSSVHCFTINHQY